MESMNFLLPLHYEDMHEVSLHFIVLISWIPSLSYFLRNGKRFVQRTVNGQGFCI